MRTFDLSLFLNSIFIFSLSFATLSLAHNKPPYDPHNCSCINICNFPSSGQQNQYGFSSSSSSNQGYQASSNNYGQSSSTTQNPQSSYNQNNENSFGHGSQIFFGQNPSSPDQSAQSSYTQNNENSFSQGNQNSFGQNNNNDNNPSFSPTQSPQSSDNQNNGNSFSQGNQNSFGQNNNNNNNNPSSSPTQSFFNQNSGNSQGNQNSFGQNNNNNNSPSSSPTQSSPNQNSGNFFTQENPNQNPQNSNQNNENSSSSSSSNQNGENSSNQNYQYSQSSSGTSGGFSYSGHFSKIYAFGDSFTDTGNAGLIQGLKSFVSPLLPQSPYGSTTSLSGQRLSNGRLMIDFLCDTIGLPSLQAYKQNSANFSSGINFAVAGATCLSNNFFSQHKFLKPLMWSNQPENVLTQLDWFHNFIQNSDCKGLSDTDCKSHLGNSLFWLGALGFSDYARIFGSAVTGRSISEVSVEHVSKFLKAFLEKGAKYIVVQGLPPAGCCPLQLFLNAFKGRDNMGCSSGINSMIIAHNELLQKKIGEFRAQFPGCVIVYADTWGAFKTIISNSKSFNFQEPFKACCGAGGGLFNFNLNSLCGAAGTSSCSNPQNYISWDGIHFTEAMHKQLANLIFHKGFCSPSFDTLIKAKMGIKV